MRAILGATAAIAMGVAVGVAGSAGTYAAWNSSVAIPGGVVQTGSTTIQVAPQSTETYGSTAALGTELSQFPAAGGWAYTTFTVKNTSTKTPVAVSLTGVTSPASESTDSGYGLYNAVKIYLQADECPSDITSLATTGTGYHLSPTFSSQPPIADLTAGNTQLVCLVFNLASGSGLAGQNINFTLDLVGNQILP